MMKMMACSSTYILIPINLSLAFEAVKINAIEEKIVPFFFCKKKIKRNLKERIIKKEIWMFMQIFLHLLIRN